MHTIILVFVELLSYEMPVFMVAMAQSRRPHDFCGTKIVCGVEDPRNDKAKFQ